MEVTGLSLEQLQKEGLEPIEAMKQFKNWVNSLVKNDETVVFVGFNASFDWSFINYYFHSFLGGIHLALRLWISNRCTSEQPRFPGKRHVPVKSRKLSSQKVLETMMHCMMRDTRQSFFA
jgi:DNA polymerase III epsilon subunit-like protein